MTKPTPPRKPEPHECCGTGCIPCVMDIYEEELWQYEKDLKAWEAISISESSATESTGPKP
jgi:Oxidoreductase-like protein, N-terminal